jgi:hypothetical protein
MPNFIDSPNCLQIPSPYTFTNLNSRWHTLPADPTALQAIVDKYLNIAPETLQYYCLFPCVFLVVNTYGKISPNLAPYHGQGYLQAKEICFVLWLVRRYQGSWGFPVFTPYIFIDNPLGAATGAMVFGFPKQVSSIAVPGDPAPTVLSTLVYPVFAPGTLLQEQEVLSISPSTNPIQESPRVEMAEWLGGFTQTLVKDPGIGFCPQVPPAARDALPAFELGFEFDSLKQLRDAADAASACYQAITSVDMVPTAFSGTWLGNYSVALNSYASLPIAQDLGLLPSPQPAGGYTSKYAFDVGKDFTFGPGRNLYVG